MKKVCKTLLISICALMLVLGFSTFASATTPNATARFATKSTVKRGKTYNLKFRLTSGSYYRVGAYYRARFDTDMYSDRTGAHVGFTDFIGFTGNVNFTVKWKFNSNVYVRKNWYDLRYRTQYRVSTSSRTWYTSSSKWVYFYVK